MTTLQIIITVALTPWFFVGWIALVFLLTKSKEDRSAYNAEVLRLMRDRNKIDLQIACNIAEIADTLREGREK